MGLIPLRLVLMTLIGYHLQSLVLLKAQSSILIQNETKIKVFVCS